MSLLGCLEYRIWSRTPSIYSYILCDLHDRMEFIGCVFPIYTSHSAFDLIISLPLQFTIYVNCSSPTLLSRKHWAASLLFLSSSGIKSPYSVRQITSSSFTLVNSTLHPFKTASPSPSMCCKKAGDKWTTIVNEATRDENYKPPL